MPVSTSRFEAMLIPGVFPLHVFTLLCMYQHATQLRVQGQGCIVDGKKGWDACLVVEELSCECISQANLL